MTYEEAVKIDSKSEGIIKGTYAMLYNTRGQKLFALQRVDCEIKDVSIFEDIKDGRVIVPIKDNTYLIETLNRKISGDDSVIDFKWDMPVVKSAGGNSTWGGRLIPVYLLKEAIDLIKEKTNKPKYTWYKVIAAYKQVPFGDWYKRDPKTAIVYEGYTYPKNIYSGSQSWKGEYVNQEMADKSLAKVISTLAKYFRNSGRGQTPRSRFVNTMSKLYKADQESALQYLLDNHYALIMEHQDELPDVIYYNIVTQIDTSENRYSAEYEELLSKLNTTSIFYVKPIAFDWNPTTIDEVVVGDIELPLTEAIEVSKAKLDKAKAILAMASATMII